MSQSPQYQILSDLEIQRLRGACHARSVVGKRDRAVVDVLLGSGIRSDELRCLLRSDIADGVLTVRCGKRENYRHVPLPGWVLDSLERWWLVAPASEWAVCTVRVTRLHEVQRPVGSQLAHNGVWNCVDKLARRADVFRTTPTGARRYAWPHLFRHTAGTRWLNGVGCEALNIREVQTLLGHKHVTTTQVYTSTDLAEIAAKFQAGSDVKACPDCAELVKYAARVCRFCGLRFEDAA